MRLGRKFLEGIYFKTGEDINDEIISSVLCKCEKGEIMRSEYVNKMFPAILYNISTEEKKAIAKIEQKYNVKVCHLIKMSMEYGTEYTYILEPKTMDDLSNMVNSNSNLAIVSNTFCTEMGSVGIETRMGGFIRIW